jgi:hypothetical protein
MLVNHPAWKAIRTTPLGRAVRGVWKTIQLKDS